MRTSLPSPVRARLSGIGATAALLLSCGGLIGYGTELGTVDVRAGSPFFIESEFVSEDAHRLWLEYDLDYFGFDYQVTGQITVAAEERELLRIPIDFTTKKGPVPKAPKISMYKRERIEDGRRCESATVLISKLPIQPEGTPLTVTGTLTPARDTRFRQVRLVLTD